MKQLSILISIGLVVGLLACALVALFALNRPLGPALSIKASPTAAQRLEPAEVDIEPPAAAQATEASSAAQGDPNACRRSGVETYLMLGEAHPVMVPRGADAIRIMKVDYDLQAVTILAIPPDLWVDTPALEDLDIDQDSLTLLYWHVKEATHGSEKHKMVAATQAFAQTITDNWDYVPDHYITISEARFTEMIDALGGIDLTLEEALDGSSEGYEVWPEGDQHLDGQSTLDFIRLLNPASGGEAGQWGRFSRQNQAMQSILAAMLEANNWPRIPDLAKHFSNVAATDLSVRQMSDLICMVREAGELAVHYQVEPEMIAVDGEGHEIADVEEVKKLLEYVRPE